MDFELSETQKIILHSAKTFLEKETKGLARNVETTDEGFSPQVWKKMTELGWLGVALPEEYGGMQGSLLDLVLLLEETGKALFPGPLIPTIITGLCIDEYGDQSQKDELLPKIIEGNLIIVPAIIRPDPALGGDIVQEETKEHDGRYTLSGTRLFVPFAHVADVLLYCAETSEGKTFFLSDAKNPGVSIDPLESLGDDKPCEVNFDGVDVPQKNLVGEFGRGEEILKKIGEWGALAQSAYIAGMLSQILKMSVEYAKQRVQFGKKIGSFQAIKHQCAEMARDLDKTKFLTYQAAWRLSEKLPAAKEISMAKACASEASRRVSLLGVKIHGGTGVSEEHDMQLYFRRAKVAEIAFGDADFHHEILAHQLGI